MALGVVLADHVKVPGWAEVPKITPLGKPLDRPRAAIQQPAY
jgi:hypothetical protein